MHCSFQRQRPNDLGQHLGTIPQHPSLEDIQSSYSSDIVTLRFTQLIPPNSKYPSDHLGAKAL